MESSQKTTSTAVRAETTSTQKTNSSKTSGQLSLHSYASEVSSVETNTTSTSDEDQLGIALYF